MAGDEEQVEQAVGRDVATGCRRPARPRPPPRPARHRRSRPGHAPAPAQTTSAPTRTRGCPAIQNTIVGLRRDAAAAMPPIAGPEHEPAGLRGPVQRRTPRPGARAGWRRRGSRGPPGRTSRSRSPASGAEDPTNATGPTTNSGSDREHGRRPNEAGDHQRPARDAVREPAEDRLADEPRGGPCGDDHARASDVDAVLGEVDRQDREQRPEADPDGQPRRRGAAGSGPTGPTRRGRGGSRVVLRVRPRMVSGAVARPGLGTAARDPRRL